MKVPINRSGVKAGNGEVVFTVDDHAFLHQMKIDPGLPPAHSPGYRSDHVIISSEVATAVVHRFGELNWDTFTAYMAADINTGGTNG